MSPENKVQVTSSVQSSSPLNDCSSSFFANPTNSSPYNLFLGLQTAIDQTGTYIFTKDTAGRYTYVNLKVQALFGATLDEIIGKDDSHFFDLEFSNEIRLNDRRVLEFDETIEQEESNVIKSTGEKRIYWTVKKPVKNNEGQIIGMCGVSTDITERKRIEDLLRENSEELKESQSIAGLGTYVLDLGTGVWKSSAVLDHIFGLDESFQRTVEGWESIILSDDTTMMHDYFLSEVMGNRHKFDKEYRIVRINDNAVRWVHGLGKLEFDFQGHPIKMHGTIQDITERKQAEEKSYQNEILLHTTLESTDEGILMIAPDGHVLSANKRFKELWRVPQTIADTGQDELLLQHVLDQLVDANEFLSLVKRLYESDEEARDILNFKDGRVFARYTQSLNVGVGKGRIWCFRDITDQKQIEVELREKEERLALATLYNGVGIWDWNLVTRQMIWDDSMYALYHIRREDFIGIEAAWRAALHPDDLAHADREVEAALRGERPFDTEFRVVWSDGEIRHIKALAKVLRDEQGKPLRMLGTNVDITERKNKQLLLERVLTEQRALLDNQLIGIVTVKNRIIQWANPAFEQMLGYKTGELNGRPSRQNYVNEEAYKALGESAYPSLIAGKIYRTEVEHKRKDGSLIWVDLSGSLLSTETNETLWCFVDITERKLAEQRLQRESEKNIALLHNASDGIHILDESGHIIEASDSFCQMLGYTRDEVIGMHVSQWDSALSDRELIKVIAKQLSSKTRSQFETRHRRKDGSEFDVEVSGFPVELLGKQVLFNSSRDITERKLTEISLKESKLRYQIIFDMNPLPMWIIDESTLAFLIVNQFAVDHYGYSREEFSRMTLRDIRPKEDVAKLDRMVTNNPNRRASGEWRHKKKDGTIINVLINTMPMMYGDKPARIVIVQDITERKLVEKNLSITASVFGISQEAIIITDTYNYIIDVNPAFTKITGFSREEVIGKNPNVLSSGRQGNDFYENMWNALKKEGVWRGEIWNRRKSGEIYPEMLSISVLRDNTGKALTHVAVFSDISNIKQHEDELVRVAHFDALTNIPNRMLLADRMKQAISQTARDKNLMAVCYLDLDGFKPINDTMGHQVGDDVLIEIAKRIGIAIRGGDTVARLGGDEFVVLLLGLTKGEECVKTIERLLETIATPIEVKNRTVSVTASIGVSIYPLDEEDPDTLLRHADQAMYIAKQSGKNRFHIYDVNLDKRARDQNDFLKSIRLALEQNQFELHYQPKVNLRTRELVGAEALIRWRHPERGLLSPSEFLRQVDNTDLDIAIGEWVTTTALAQIHLWRSMGLDIEVSINISGYHLETKDFVSKLQQQLTKYPVLPFGKLQIEVLETVALNDVTSVQGIIESCRKIGVGFALDDFGTGYSSLSYLSALPVDTLKIDQSFVRDMLEDKGDKAIVQGISALAKAFGRQTVAEGIETEAHCQALLEMGCEFGQGYLFSKPVTADNFEEMFKRDRDTIKLADQNAVILRLSWQASYECGEHTIDQEHHTLLDLANTLIEFAFTRNENPKGFENAMDVLLTHVVKHFADEEAILTQHHYSDLDKHKVAHKALIEQAIRLRNSTAKGDATIGEWVNFIAGQVIAHHMLQEDRKFYPLFNKLRH